MIKTISLVRGKWTRFINVPKQMLIDTGLYDEKSVQIENVDDMIIITKVKSNFKKEQTNNETDR